MCGEKPVPTMRPDSWAGSSPHVRGKVTYKDSGKNANRITPACAGKSLNGARMAANSKDHPRVCGEKFPSKLLSVVILGSPPRVRGKAQRKAHA